MNSVMWAARNRARMAKLNIGKSTQQTVYPPNRLNWQPQQPKDEPMKPTVENIIRSVCLGENVTRIDMMSRRRIKRLTVPRHIIAWLARHLTSRTYPEIARTMGDRNHTTIMNSVEVIEKQRVVDPALQRKLDRYVDIFQEKSPQADSQEALSWGGRSEP